MASESRRKEIWKRWLIVVPVAIALVVMSMMVRKQKQPPQNSAAEVSLPVRVVRLQPIEVIPRSIGYGYVEPGQVWTVVPEVSGRIIAVSPAFKKGNFVPTGEVLVKIDPVDYELTVRQMQANIANIEAQLAELERQKKNYRNSLSIQKTLLNLKQKELARSQKAMQTRAISSSALDQSQMDYQSQLAQVRDIENSIALIPTSRQALEAELDSTRAQLEAAQLDLERTEIKAPFACRVTETSAEVGQYVQQGASIASADGIGRAEINAQIPMGMMRKMMAGMPPPPAAASTQAMEPTIDPAIDPAVDLTMDRNTMEAIKERFGLKVKVRLVNAEQGAVWDGYFTRTDATIDSQTRTVGVIVAVDDPYSRLEVRKRPPLVRNMFCEVEVSGRALQERLVIPRAALHDGHVYVVDQDSRLQRRAVKVAFSQSDFCLIDDGLTAGEQIVVSDVMPAIEGMLLSVTEDDEIAERLSAQAGGLTAIR